MTHLYPARWRSLIMFAAAACGTAIGLFGFAASGSPWGFLVLVIVFAPLALLYLKRLVFRSPVIGIGPEGIEAPSKGLLRWEEVDVIYPYNIGDYSYMGIVSKHNDTSAGGLRGLGLKLDAWRTGKQLWHSFTLEELSFKDTTRLHDLLNQHHAPVGEPIEAGMSRRQVRKEMWKRGSRRII